MIKNFFILCCCYSLNFHWLLQHSNKCRRTSYNLRIARLGLRSQFPVVYLPYRKQLLHMLRFKEWRRTYCWVVKQNTFVSRQTRTIHIRLSSSQKVRCTIGWRRSKYSRMWRCDLRLESFQEPIRYTILSSKTKNVGFLQDDEALCHNITSGSGGRLKKTRATSESR